jgi:hypothetical protein
MGLYPFNLNGQTMIFEKIKLPSGKEVRRIKVSVLLSLSVLCLPVGIFMYLGMDMTQGFFLILTLCPFLIIYVIVREIFFAGEDSVAGVITSIVVEEVLKHKLTTKKKRERF